MRRAAVSLTLAALIVWTPAAAAVDEVRLSVKGLACAFCTYGIEKNLKKLPGVASVETTIKTGIVRLRLTPAATFDLVALQQAVAKSGFTLSHIEATVTGRLTRHETHPAIDTDPPGQTFSLVGPVQGESSEPLSAVTLDKLTQASGDGSRRLTVSGRVHGHVQRPPSLSVETFEVAK